MNRFLLCSAVLLLAYAPLIADSDIPANAWEQHPGVIALAVIMTKRMDASGLKIHLVAHAKNTSSALIALGNQGDGMFAAFFYIDDHQSQVPLKGPELDVENANPLAIGLSPGETKSVAEIDVVPGDVAQLKIHPLICTVTVYDTVTKQKSVVNSLPKMVAIQP